MTQTCLVIRWAIQGHLGPLVLCLYENPGYGYWGTSNEFWIRSFHGEKYLLFWLKKTVACPGAIIGVHCSRAISRSSNQWLKHWWFIYHGWFELLFGSQGNSSDGSRKQIFRDILGKFSYFIMRLDVVCTHYNVSHCGDSYEHTKILLFYRRSNFTFLSR